MAAVVTAILQCELCATEVSELVGICAGSLVLPSDPPTDEEDLSATYASRPLTTITYKNES